MTTAPPKSQTEAYTNTTSQVNPNEYTNGNGRLASRSRSRSASAHSDRPNGHSNNHLEQQGEDNQTNNNSNNEGDDDHEMMKADISNGDIYDPTKSDCEDDEANGNAIVNADCSDNNVEADLN